MNNSYTIALREDGNTFRGYNLAQAVFPISCKKGNQLFLARNYVLDLVSALMLVEKRNFKSQFEHTVRTECSLDYNWNTSFEKRLFKRYGVELVQNAYDFDFVEIDLGTSNEYEKCLCYEGPIYGNKNLSFSWIYPIRPLVDFLRTDQAPELFDPIQKPVICH